MTLPAQERRVLEQLDAAVRSVAAAPAIAAIVARVEQVMARDRGAIEAWEPIPLDVYADRLPQEIRSSWVFILRGHVTTGAERHPNSHQRMMSWRGQGDFQVHDGERWQSHLMASGPSAALEDRWISIPPNVWHQGVISGSDWVVVSFHTVPARELIEERPDSSDLQLTRQRKYLDVQQL
jgi:hypothetical protein